MRACSGVWIAHGSGSADRRVADAHGRVSVPPGEEAYTLRRVWLSPEDEKGYHYGFSNEGLWALCHMAHARPVLRIDDWKHYQTVNRRFADALHSEVDTEDPVVLAQDYHFALLPALIRQRAGSDLRGVRSTSFRLLPREGTVLAKPNQADQRSGCLGQLGHCPLSFVLWI
jgi:trehalose 6-phosphate synthase